MIVAIALFALYVMAVMAVTKSGWSTKIQHEWFVALTGGVAFVYTLVVVMWVVSALGPYGQAPDFPLWIYLVLGGTMSAGAIRSSMLYSQKYGITLA